MTKIASGLAEVYDLIYPSPATLKEISSIAVAFELQREEVEEKIDLKKVLPRLPPVIYDLLEERLADCGLSIRGWQSSHRDICKKTLTKNFYDVAYDWNGQIHYVRTARRMMRCERLNEEEKFEIACEYCFENDIELIWPSVSRKMDLNEIQFRKFPLLFYWICRLKGEMEKIPNPDNRLIDHIMLMKCDRYSWSSREYFWNRIPVEKQLQTAKENIDDRPDDFFPFLTRFIMNKLNEHQLDELIAEKGSNLVETICYFLGSNIRSDNAYILPTWLFIRNKINESDFTSLIETLLENITNNKIVDAIVKEQLRPTDPLHIAKEIWKTASLSLRRSAIMSILNNGELFYHGKFFKPSEPRELRFLIAVLLDASIEERSEFFLKNWTDLIQDTRFNDFDLLIEFCLKNKNEIVEFKRNTMGLGQFENIDMYIGQLLQHGYFVELNDFLTYCHPDMKTRREVMQRLLRLEFLGEESCLHRIIRKVKLLDEFISSSFDSIDSATDFKNQISSSPVTEESLFKAIERGNFTYIMDFANIFASAQAQVHLKERLFNYLKDLMIIGGTVFLKPDEFQIFLVWCLGNEDEVDKLKQSISPDDIFRNMVRYLKYDEDRETLTDDLYYAKKRYRENMLDSFWQWYFTSSEEIENLKERFSGELTFDKKKK